MKPRNIHDTATSKLTAKSHQSVNTDKTVRHTAATRACLDASLAQLLNGLGDFILEFVLDGGRAENDEVALDLRRRFGKQLLATLQVQRRRLVGGQPRRQLVLRHHPLGADQCSQALLCAWA